MTKKPHIWLISGHKIKDVDQTKRDFTNTWVMEGYCSIQFRDVRKHLEGFSKQQIKQAVEHYQKDEKPGTQTYVIAQLNNFYNKMEPGNLVVTRTAAEEVHVGVVGIQPVTYHPDEPCIRRRPVWWNTANDPLPRDLLPAGLWEHLYARKRQTVCDISQVSDKIDEMLSLVDARAAAEEPQAQGAFSLTGSNSYSHSSLTRHRPDQRRFRQAVFARYAGRCPLSGMAVDEMLEAAHLRPDAENGSSDAGNGLLMNAALHSAFDAFLFAIHPQTLEVCVRPQGPDMAAMGIVNPRLKLDRKPHADALRWRYDEWLRVVTEGRELGLNR